MSIRYWIGQEDYLTRKALIEMNMEIEGEALRLTMQMAFSDFDEPVKIPDPTVLEMDA